MPLLQWKENFFRYVPYYDADVYVYSVIYVYMAHLFLVLGFFFIKGNRRAYSFSGLTINPVFLKTICKFSVAICLIGCYFAYKNARAIISMGFENYMSDRISMGVNNGFSILAAHWIYVSCLLFYFIIVNINKIKNTANYNKKLYKYTFLFFIFSFAVTIAYYSITSNRNSILILIINIIIVNLVFSTKKRSFKAIFNRVIYVLLSFGLLFSIGKFRAKTLIDDKANYSYVEGLNGAFGNHENIVWLLDNNYELQYGVTYLAGITNFIPRSIWSNKPLGAGPRIKNMIYPGSYIVGQAGNSSLTTGLYNELQINFGILGMFIGAFLFGIFLKLLYSKVLALNNPILFFLGVYSLILLSSQFLYAEFLGFMARYIFSIIPVLITYALSKKSSTKRYRVYASTLR